MPWTLYRYILIDLLRLLGLTSAVLVTVLSFAAAIQPMADGLLSSSLLVKFVLFTAPTVLGFALPFAGAFASTLVFIRLASDNEILACSASGISYRRVLAPVLGLGLVLTLGMFYLANFVVPSFFRMAERTVDSDVITVLVSQLNQSQPFEVKDQNLVIYADSATEFPPQVVEDSQLPMTQLIQLEGVVVGETDHEGHIVQDTTAARATLAVFGERDKEDVWVRLNLEDVVRYDPLSGGLGRIKSLRSRPIKVPSPLRDNTSFLSSSQLTQLSQQPERFDKVRDAMQNLASALATENLRQALIATKDRAVLHGVLSGDRYVVVAPHIVNENDTLRLAGSADNPVEVKLYTHGQTEGQPVRVYTALSATMSVQTNAVSPEPTIDMELYDVTVTSGGGGPAGGDKTIPIRQMSWPRPIFHQAANEILPKDLLGMAGLPMYEGSDRIVDTSETLTVQIDSLQRRVIAQRHERAASAVSCSLLLLLGALLSIQMKAQTPLVVYFWSFVLAIITLIIINSGENLAGSVKSSLTSGLLVLWSGNLLLVAVIALTYRKLSRH